MTRAVPAYLRGVIPYRVCANATAVARAVAADIFWGDRDAPLIVSQCVV